MKVSSSGQKIFFFCVAVLSSWPKILKIKIFFLMFLTFYRIFTFYSTQAVIVRQMHLQPHAVKILVPHHQTHWLRLYSSSKGTAILDGFLPNVSTQFQNHGIPLADSSLKLMVSLVLSNKIEGFWNWAGTFGKNPSRMSVHTAERNKEWFCAGR